MLISSSFGSVETKESTDEINEKGGRKEEVEVGRVKGQDVKREGEKGGERRCGDIDSLASLQFNTTELLLHSSPYEMRSLSPQLVFSVAFLRGTCVYVSLYCTSGSILHNLDLKVHLLSVFASCSL